MRLRCRESESMTPETRVRTLGGGQKFNFLNFDSFEVLGRSGVYRHTFGMIFYRPHGLVGERWAINREVSGSIL